MVLANWSPGGASLQSRYECTLSHVGTHCDMTFDLTRMYVNLQQPTKLSVIGVALRTDGNYEPDFTQYETEVSSFSMCQGLSQTVSGKCWL